MPAIFIRLAGCNLACPWCDTDFTEKSELDEDGILLLLRQWPCKRVILTGGEPSVQDLEPLLKTLKSERYYVAIETNGTNSLLRYKGHGLIDWITVSPKTPEIRVDAVIDEIKVVWPTELSLASISQATAKYHYIQPCDDEHKAENTKSAIKYILENPKWRLSVQTQKILKLR